MRDPQTKKHGQVFPGCQSGPEATLWYPVGRSDAEKAGDRWKGIVVRSERQLPTVNAATRRDIMKKDNSEKIQKKVALKDLKARKEVKGGRGHVQNHHVR